MLSFKDDLLKAATFLPLSLQHPNGWCGHLPFAAWLMQGVRPKIFVELGTHSGNSYFSFCQAVYENNLATKCYAVDTWEGDEHAGLYPDEIFDQVNAHNQKYYAQFSRLLKMRFDEAADYFSKGSIELLHIDGLHTYEAVKHDFETWLPKLAPGAIVLFHDINVREKGFGVWKLWEELQARYPNNIEFPHSHGLGVLQIDGASNFNQQKWLTPEYGEKQQLKDYFSNLGERQLERFERNYLHAHIKNLNRASEEKVVALSQQIANLSKTLNERDVLIEDLGGKVIEQEKRIADLYQNIFDRDSRIATLNQMETDHAQQFAHFTYLLAERDGQISNLTQAIAEFRESTSWTITRPVRFVGRQLFRIKIIYRALPYAKAMCGGYRGIFEHLWRTFQDEGIKGIKRRIAFSASPGTPPPTLHYEEPAHNDYSEWVRRYDTMTDSDRKKIRSKINRFTRLPLISIVMPVYNPPIHMLKDAIESVQNQLYPNWELCIADDASTDESVRTLLQNYTNSDHRIKVIFRAENGHISAASNSALELVSGEFIALLDNDDVLSEQALFWVAQAIIDNPKAGLIYSDEDKVDITGKRYDPYFKPDWNPDLFLSHNMICHLGAYRTDLIRQLGGFREGYEGAQDYDLALRCTEQLTAEQIVHIPRVLYHWRSHPGSTAQAASEKNYALLAGQQALTDHFNRMRVSAKVELLDFGMYRARYDIPQSPPLVSLIIPTRNGFELLKQCVTSILDKTSYQNYEILIVDNNSDDPETLNYLKKLSSEARIRIRRDTRPFNYSALNNAAVLDTKGEYLALINNDIEVISPYWLDEMIGLATQPGVGAVGARLWYPTDTLQHGGCITGVGGVAGHAHKHLPKGQFGYFARAQLIQTVSVVTAACLVIRKNIYQEVNGLDEVNLKVAFNDVDFCLRVREAGYRNVWTPYAELYHHESATRGYEDTAEKQSRFQAEVIYMQKRWGKVLYNDPAYSPNLTLEREDFSFAWPPRVEPLTN